LTLEKLKKEILYWNRLAIVVPIAVTLILGFLYFCTILEAEILFYLACFLYFSTAVIWWWWTMRGLIYLADLMRSMREDIAEATNDIKDIKQEILVDKNTN
jgi:hypothetical protein